jgi:Stress responsive A/B Barrel Domain
MSVRRVALVTVREGAEPEAIAELENALARAHEHCPGALRSHAARNLPGSIGGGDLTWDVWFESRAAASVDPPLRDLIAGIDAVIVDPIAAHVGDPALVGVKRTLLLRVQADASRAEVEAFERDMLAMPSHVPAIRNWSFARAIGAHAVSTHWTHVWEQEFATLDGLTLDYMMSPYHWGLVDGWFDAECPQCIVSPRLAHVFCNARESVLSGPIDRSAR